MNINDYINNYSKLSIDNTIKYPKRRRYKKIIKFTFEIDTKNGDWVNNIVNKIQNEKLLSITSKNISNLVDNKNFIKIWKDMIPNMIW